MIEEDFKKALNLAAEAVRIETNEGGNVKVRGRPCNVHDVTFEKEDFDGMFMFFFFF